MVFQRSDDDIAFIWIRFRRQRTGNDVKILSKTEMPENFNTADALFELITRMLNE